MTKKVEQRAYHGKIDPEALARALVAQFNQGETRAQWTRGTQGRTAVQIQNRKVERGDPTTAITLHITPSETGVVLSMSEQQWLSVAADMAKSGLLALLNPWNLIGELDDIARNVRSLQLRQEVWQGIETYCRGVGAGIGTASQLQHIVCPYCGTPNPLGTLTCQACHAPLAEVQPVVCPRCGYLNDPRAQLCVNCGAPLVGTEATK
ncbi:MAG: hypothetical protein DRI37_01975 [Chloroflexi bacterium]|nr:MAG: hypothetical protein DRI37_01975 [Chloroflexota bacterium]